MFTNLKFCAHKSFPLARAEARYLSNQHCKFISILFHSSGVIACQKSRKCVFKIKGHFLPPPPGQGGGGLFKSTRCLNGCTCTLNIYRSIAIENIENKDTNIAAFDIIIWKYFLPQTIRIN